jgi:hypothetical protein
MDGIGPVLDTDFGYYPVAPDLYPSDQNEWIIGDSPSQAFLPGDLHAEALDSFHLYTLFVPQGGTYVPLKELKWFWKGSATPDSTGIWHVYATDAEWSLEGDFPPHPTWTMNIADEVDD